ncbi:Hypothetical predicted protein [Paramuricea clavata]|uniref:Uncharacterized protein n=1 Tax=Paramuricea clavata TaxID=317549 RepID=A0A7D9HAT1_PARCT|nr:Hypothetical predicted protein [Paramuricea clavata]
MKRARTSPEVEPIEEHDSGFVGPMTLFDTFPHNDTFEETRQLHCIASPVDNQAEVYTFMHNRQDYSVFDTNDAKLYAKLRLHTMAGNAVPAADRRISVNMAPLKFGWKTKAGVFK